jgi:uncharacterized membrane protein
MVIKKILEEKNIRRIFEISLILKGISALLEIGGGIAAYFISAEWLVSYIQNLAEAELIENPHSFIANYLLHWAQNFSISSQHFAAFYLLSHGVIKLWLVIGLFRNKLWYYPTAIIFFGMFILYQLYRFMFTHSILLILITILDVIVIILTWHEYRYLTKE